MKQRQQESLEYLSKAMQLGTPFSTTAERAALYRNLNMMLRKMPPKQAQMLEALSWFVRGKEAEAQRDSFLDQIYDLDSLSIVVEVLSDLGLVDQKDGAPTKKGRKALQLWEEDQGKEQGAGPSSSSGAAAGTAAGAGAAATGGAAAATAAAGAAKGAAPAPPKRHVCSWCSSAEGAKVCTACRSAWYCGVNCQRLAWPSHEKTCKAAKESAAA